MKRIRVLLVCMLCILPLVMCSCKKKIPKVTLDEIRQTDIKNIADLERYKNLRLPDKVLIPNFDSLGTIRATWNTEEILTEEEIRLIIQKVADLSNGIEIDETRVKNLSDSWGGEYEFTSENEEIRISGIGRYLADVLDESILKETPYGNAKIQKFFHVLRGDALEGEYTLIDDSIVSIAEAKQFADTKVKDLSFLLYPGEQVQLKSAAVLGMKNKHMYMFVYEKTMKGLPLSSECDYSRCKQGFSKPTMWVMLLDGKDHIYSFDPVYSNYYDETLSTTYDEKQEYVSLEGAIKTVSDYLAKEHQYDVSEIRLEYACLTKFEKEETVLKDADYRPVWSFVLEENADRTLVTQHPLHQIVAYVDLVQGDLMIVNNITGDDIQ